MENLNDLNIKVSSVYCSDERYIEIRQITAMMQLNGQKGNWFLHCNGYMLMYDVCYTERQPYGNGYKYVQTPLSYNKIPQHVLNYLRDNNYIYRE